MYVCGGGGQGVPPDSQVVYLRELWSLCAMLLPLTSHQPCSCSSSALHLPPPAPHLPSTCPSPALSCPSPALTCSRLPFTCPSPALSAPQVFREGVLLGVHAAGTAVRCVDYCRMPMGGGSEEEGEGMRGQGGGESWRGPYLAVSAGGGEEGRGGLGFRVLVSAWRYGILLTDCRWRPVWGHRGRVMDVSGPYGQVDLAVSIFLRQSWWLSRGCWPQRPSAHTWRACVHCVRGRARV